MHRVDKGERSSLRLGWPLLLMQCAPCISCLHSLQIYDSLEITPEKIDNAITDRIPERPVGVVEGTSYSLIILAAFAVSGVLQLRPPRT